VNEPAAAVPGSRTGRGAGPLLLLALLLAAAGWYGWARWQAHRADARAEQVHDAQRLVALEARVEAVRRGQRAQAERLQHADATNRLLREELLGIGQRAALLEDSVARLADPDRHGAQALRLDEVELLLSTAQHRLAVAADLDGARRAHALAAGLLEGVDDPAYLDLRQTLAQERAALDALGTDPKALAAGRLDALAAALAALPARAPAATSQRTAWWRRLLARVVEANPSGDVRIVAPAERGAGMLALQLELSLARAALERRNEPDFRSALARIDAWLARLWPASPALRQQRDAVRALQAQSLQLDLPVLGTTLEQLRRLRAAP